MSMVYHSYNSNHAAINELVAGAYAEHTGTLGFDEDLSSISRNAVENRVITARILEDEDKYLLKTDASTTYVAKSNFAKELNTAIQAYYPVGTIYMNDRSSSVPFDFGTWQLIDGKFLYGCNSSFSGIGTPGGNATVTLTKANLPSDSISITIPSLSGTAASASTEHTHSGTSDANNRGHSHSVTVNGSSIGGMKAVQVADGLNLATVQFYGGTGTGYSHAHSASAGGESQNHTHTFTTGNMSKNSTHTHTVTTDASSTSVRLGSGKAFSIIPPYHKCAIWHRVA